MKSAIGRLYPSSKFCFMLLIIIITIFTPGYWLQYAMFPLFVVLSLFSRTGVKFLKAFLASIALVVVVIFLAQVCIVHYPDTQHLWAFVGLSPTGLSKSLGITSKIVASAAAIMWFFQVTRTKDMVYAMEAAHLPKKVTFVTMSTLQMVPQVASASKTIMEAQESRGIQVDGGIWKRMTSFVPMLGPLIFSLVQQTEEHALALQSRAFLSTARKTSLYKLDKHRVDWLIQGLCLLGLIAYLIWRLL
ncbi:energy-coupling factor transporter transmembrane protein EcfT [Bombiscardovia nodaiensis]|uniref:Energy-coupling factor transporter transmembrane protein EcfT n=1 Tax=Bombiscardovia nodaiensis TaxID=2932181 RepID=A0ABM8B9J4_9BIFI|nr:energy-coupling factor transporter transmembrane protein EcfT [Bombiscardovia nodaiensis]